MSRAMEPNTQVLVEGVLQRLRFYGTFGIDLRGRTVLDVGCGPTGHYALAFATVADHVIAVDPRKDRATRAGLRRNTVLQAWVDPAMSSVAVRSAESAVSRVQCRKDALPELATVPSESIGFVFCVSILEHVTAPLVDCVRSIERVLAPGGAAWVSWAPFASLHGCHIGQSRLSDWEHVRRSRPGFIGWLAQEFGEDYAKSWQQTHPEFLREEQPLIGDLEDAVARTGLAVMLHNTAQKWRHPLRDKRREELTAMGYLVRDLRCSSDVWLLRKPA